ncbi:MAG: hypothetical protein R3F37_09170 [Candidatus Competibacteraceae bacterium]
MDSLGTLMLRGLPSNFEIHFRAVFENDQKVSIAVVSGKVEAVATRVNGIPSEIDAYFFAFVHIPKTAGTSFRQEMSRIVGNERVLMDYGYRENATSEIVSNVYEKKEVI